MSITRICTSLILACGIAQAAEGGDVQPIVEATLHDAQRSIDRLWETPLGRLWQDPVLADIRARVEQEWEKGRDQARQQSGLDPQTVIESVGAGHFVLKILDIPTKTMRMRGQLALGAVAEPLLKLAETQMPSIPVAGADGAVRIQEDDSPAFVLARYGQQLVFADEASVTAPQAVAAGDDDLSGRIDVGAVMRIAEQAMSMMGQQMPELPYQPDLSFRLKVIPEGFIEEWSTSTMPASPYRPVDIHLLDHLPANTAMVAAMGLDGEQLWNQSGLQLLQQLAQAQGTDAMSLKAAVDQQLAAMGINATLDGLISNIDGTIALAVGPGVPAPSVCLILPSTPEIDQILALVLKMGFQKELPAVGTNTIMPLPNVPMVMLNITRSDKAWMIGNNAAAAGNLAAGNSGGWAGSPAASRALARLPGTPDMIATSDTKALLTMINGYLSMAMMAVQGPQRQQVQLGMQAMQKLSTMVDSGYIVAGADGQGGWRLEARGLITPMGLYALAVPAALWAGMRSQAMTPMGVRAIEPSQVRMLLAAELMTAQTACRGGAYIDGNSNSQGEFAFPSELAGAKLASGRSLQILDKRWAGGQPVTIDGLRLRVWLPNGPGQAIDNPAGRAPGGHELREQHYVAYAWPADDMSPKMWAIDENGVVYVSDYWGIEPAWNELYGGGDWGSEATWTPMP